MFGMFPSATGMLKFQIRTRHFQILFCTDFDSEHSLFSVRFLGQVSLDAEELQRLAEEGVDFNDLSNEEMATWEIHKSEFHRAKYRMIWRLEEPRPI